MLSFRFIPLRLSGSLEIYSHDLIQKELISRSAIICGSLPSARPDIVCSSSFFSSEFYSSTFYAIYIYIFHSVVSVSNESKSRRRPRPTERERARRERGRWRGEAREESGERTQETERRKHAQQVSAFSASTFSFDGNASETAERIRSLRATKKERKTMAEGL